MENQELKMSDFEIEYPKWIPIDTKENQYQCFQQEGEPVVVHIIKTGYENTYIVTIEDGYDMAYFESKIRTKEDIEHNFGIKIKV